jgi:hypothetical protein
VLETAVKISSVIGQNPLDLLSTGPLVGEYLWYDISLVVFVWPVAGACGASCQYSGFVFIVIAVGRSQCWPINLAHVK